jgi:gamma-glutamylcyclotransferase (GGCT)/AIG2-like uncharacterized protein YtfP
MCEEIMSRVAGGRFARASATLRNYGRFAVKAQVYPAIVKNPGAIVEGFLYYDLPPASWARLDKFEGEMYERVVVPVTCGDGRSLDSATYVLRHRFRYLLGDTEWNVEEFFRSGKNRFEATYFGFGRLD